MVENQAKFGSDEVLWFNNGRWGEAGYAVPNPAGKTWTNNTVIFSIHQLLGRSMFELMHRVDVRFSSPPHKQFWFDLHQIILIARKRLADEAVADNDSNRFEPKHETPVPRQWIVYPVPFFGERIRQPDVRLYCELGLGCLSEIMQHSDNERTGYYTTRFAADVGVYLQEILAKFSMKYFNKTRTEVYTAGFALKDTDFTAYDPSKVLLNVEMTDERPPLQWWPTENDLSQIRGIAINDALVLCQRWPASPWLNQADGNVSLDKGAATIAEPNNLQGAQSVGGAFIQQPGVAP